VQKINEDHLEDEESDDAIPDELGTNRKRVEDHLLICLLLFIFFTLLSAPTVARKICRQ